MNVNENNSIAYTQGDGTQRDNTQNTSVYTSDNLVSTQQIQTQNSLLHSDENIAHTPVNLQKDFVQSDENIEEVLEKGAFGKCTESICDQHATFTVK